MAARAGTAARWRIAPNASSCGTRDPRISNTIRRNGTNSWLPELVSAGMTRPLTLLLSAHAFKTWGSRIGAAVPARGLVFPTAEGGLAADGPREAGIAFMTRGVTGRPGKDQPPP